VRREDEVDRRHFKKTSFTLSSGRNNIEDAKAVFDMIRGMPEEYCATAGLKALKDRLETSQSRIDVTDIFNSQGHTALTFAASQGKISAMRCLIDFI